MHFLVTRPKKQAAKTAKALNELGHNCTIEPLLKIRTISSALPATKFDGLIITSINSLPMLDTAWPDDQREAVPLLSTGLATAEGARSIGFCNVRHVSGSALNLVDAVPDWMSQNNLSNTAQLLYPAAETIAQDVAGLLLKQSISVHRWTVYRAEPVSCFSTQAQIALKNGEIDVVLLYSKRTAHTFVQLMEQNEIPMTKLTAYVLSREISKALPDDLKNQTRCAKQPSETELLKLIGS
ncbi:MAG: hypothetical protein GKR97_04975 [Rhizobiaceae bacterium]|nr:hypothetical protein [Rhizobiaceae bacterium]